MVGIRDLKGEHLGVNSVFKLISFRFYDRIEANTLNREKKQSTMLKGILFNGDINQRTSTKHIA